jgi:aryl-alcohol dehydrogenase-like predicted oxidoreductase
MSSVTNHSRYLASHLDPARPGHAYPVMKKRPLGDSGIVVGEIGTGTAALARTHGVVVPDAEAIQILSYALDMQASLVDVAPTYGDGRALNLLRQAMQGRRGQTQVSLKAGYFSDGHSDFSPAAVRASLEDSLRKLGTDYVDVLLLHNPATSVLAATDPIWAELAKFKLEGKVRAMGASLAGADQLKAALEKTPAQVLQFPFNVFAQEAASVFDAAFKKRVGLIANRPLDSGFLTGRYRDLAFFLDDRSRFSRADISRRGELQSAYEPLAMRPDLTPTQAALEFVLSFPQLSCAIPGASDWHHVIGNVTANQEPMPAATVAKLKSLWEAKVKASPLPL